LKGELMPLFSLEPLTDDLLTGSLHVGCKKLKVQKKSCRIPAGLIF
jgi:hypothetical protein